MSRYPIIFNYYLRISYLNTVKRSLKLMHVSLYSKQKMHIQLKNIAYVSNDGNIKQYSKILNNKTKRLKNNSYYSDFMSAILMKVIVILSSVKVKSKFLCHWI